MIWKMSLFFWLRKGHRIAITIKNTIICECRRRLDCVAQSLLWEEAGLSPFFD
jgi:hypothetical protein